MNVLRELISNRHSMKTIFDFDDELDYALVEFPSLVDADLQGVYK